MNQTGENGYSKDYGFPHTKEYMRDGFMDEFWLRGSQLGERFKPSPFHVFPKGFMMIRSMRIIGIMTIMAGQILLLSITMKTKNRAGSIDICSPTRSYCYE
ncbi:MAG: hypothetical protein ABSB81_04830 [Halobacteriota archaeon]|jgi:hypothetical protein